MCQPCPFMFNHAPSFAEAHIHCIQVWVTSQNEAAQSNKHMYFGGFLCEPLALMEEIQGHAAGRGGGSLT